MFLGAGYALLMKVKLLSICITSLQFIPTPPQHNSHKNPYPILAAIQNDFLNKKILYICDSCMQLSCKPNKKRLQAHVMQLRPFQQKHPLLEGGAEERARKALNLGLLFSDTAPS